MKDREGEKKKFLRRVGLNLPSRARHLVIDREREEPQHARESRSGETIHRKCLFCVSLGGSDGGHSGAGQALRAMWPLGRPRCIVVSPAAPAPAPGAGIGSEGSPIYRGASRTQSPIMQLGQNTSPPLDSTSPPAGDCSEAHDTFSPASCTLLREGAEHSHL